jgi:hypothetical protein
MLQYSIKRNGDACENDDPEESFNLLSCSYSVKKYEKNDGIGDNRVEPL